MSCDSRLTLAAWKQAMGFTARLVSDFWPHGEIGGRYGVFDAELGVNTRCGFVIDAEGTVCSVIASPNLLEARDVSRYLDAVAELTGS